jgi:hypothetical protein
MLIHRHETHLTRLGKAVACVPQAGRFVVRPSVLRTILAKRTSIGAVGFAGCRRRSGFDLRRKSWRKHEARGNDRCRGDCVKGLDGTSPCLATFAIFFRGNACSAVWLLIC